MKLLLTILALSCAILAVSSQDKVDLRESQEPKIPTRFRRWGFDLSKGWEQISNFTKEAVEKVGENKIVQAGVQKAKEITNSTKETIGDIGEKIAENEFVQAGVEKAKEITDSTKEKIGNIAADENVQNGIKKGEELTGSAIEAAKEFGKKIEDAVHRKVE